MPTLCIPLRRLFRRNASARQEEIVVVVLEGRKMMIFFPYFFVPAKKYQKSRAEIDVQHDFGPRLD